MQIFIYSGAVGNGWKQMQALKMHTTWSTQVHSLTRAPKHGLNRQDARVSPIPAFQNLDPTDTPTEIIPRWEINVRISWLFMNIVNFHTAHYILNKFPNVKARVAYKMLKD